MDLFPATRRPLLLEINRVLVGVRHHSHENATRADSGFIVLEALFGYSPVSKSDCEAPRQGNAAGGRKCCGQGPGNDEAQAGEHEHRTCLLYTSDAADERSSV